MLIVEDDESIRTVLQSILEFEGYHVVTANNGKDALETLTASYAPDLIFLDIKMPQMDGREFICLIKNDAQLALIPIVIMTATDGKPIDLQEADCLMKKPFDLNQVIGTARKFTL